MILKLIMILLTQTFGFLAGIVFPSLPSGITSHWNVLMEYIQNGYGFITVFIDTSYVAQLFGWWLTLGTLIISVELMMWIWKAVTGNISNEYVSESVSEDGTTYTRTSSGIRYGKPFIRSRTRQL